MARPIPLHLLIHSVTHRVGTPDMYGNTSWTDTTVNKVRLEPSKQTALTDLGESRDDKYLMMWDARFSTAVTFNKGDRIIFNGVELTIRQIYEAYDEMALHHLEIYLT